MGMKAIKRIRQANPSMLLMLIYSIAPLRSINYEPIQAYFLCLSYQLLHYDPEFLLGHIKPSLSPFSLYSSHLMYLPSQNRQFCREQNKCNIALTEN